MAHCPSCRAEYEDTVTSCHDCGAPLASGALPPEKETGWSLLRTVTTDEDAALLSGFLEAEGIEVMIEPVNVHALPETLGELAEIRLLVRGERAADAEKLLAEREGEFARTGSDDEAVMTDDGAAHIEDDSEMAT